MHFEVQQSGGGFDDESELQQTIAIQDTESESESAREVKRRLSENVAAA